MSSAPIGDQVQALLCFLSSMGSAPIGDQVQALLFFLSSMGSNLSVRSMKVKWGFIPNE